MLSAVVDARKRRTYRRWPICVAFGISLLEKPTIAVAIPERVIDRAITSQIGEILLVEYVPDKWGNAARPAVLPPALIFCKFR